MSDDVVDLSGLYHWAKTMSGKRHPDLSPEDVNQRIQLIDDKRKAEKAGLLAEPSTKTSEQEVRALQIRVRVLEWKNHNLDEALRQLSNGGQCPYCETPLAIGYANPPLERGSPEETWHIPVRCQKIMREKGLSEKRKLHPIEVESLQDVRRFAERIQCENDLPWWNPRKWVMRIPPGLDKKLLRVVNAAKYE